MLWADDGVRLRRALNGLLERAYAKRQAQFNWPGSVTLLSFAAFLVEKHPKPLICFVPGTLSETLERLAQFCALGQPGLCKINLSPSSKLATNSDALVTSSDALYY